MAKRLTFQCWHCAKTYELTRDLEDKPELLVACPYCYKKAVVDLNRFRDDTVEVQRGDDPVTLDTLDLPDPIPTTKPANSDT